VRLLALSILAGAGGFVNFFIKWLNPSGGGDKRRMNHRKCSLGSSSTSSGNTSAVRHSTPSLAKKNSREVDYYAHHMSLERFSRPGPGEQGGVRILFGGKKVKNAESVNEQGGLCSRCRAIVFSPLPIRINPGQLCSQCQVKIQRMIEASIVDSLTHGEMVGQLKPKVNKIISYNINILIQEK